MPGPVISDAVAGAWDYGYPSLTKLLRDYKVRSLELDAMYDPQGGKDT